ncbi:DoxX family protein [Pedobacter foliorum]|uniref:DoxX family protein n=1 Tax=Pedobacter foliorum TaxID=2739058 RepID=UPI0015658CF6|nr:DoxX family protein [Pedobacter foliorum]NRF37768.1 DoxX family protein [Pedobacter foliorum]
MKKYSNAAQLFLRIALGLAFLSAVLDRIGWLGMAGQANIAWGNWASFQQYTHTLLPFFPKQLSDIMGITATVAEALFGLLLIVGYKTKTTAIGSFILLLSFGLMMTLVLGLKAPLNYSVFSASAGALLLASLPSYKWSLDNLMDKSDKD